MPLNLSIPELTELKPRISVIGVGGAGGNAVTNMIESQLEGVDFIVANTDAQALGLSKAESRIQLGVKTTQGLGAGAMPQVGEAAAEESIDEILEHVGNAHMLFITAGMGGGTGTGAAPVIARAAKERDILTVGVVTKPFHFEGARRMKIAMAGIEAMQEHVDTLLIIPNQNLFSIANERTTFHEAFALADQVLHSGVRGITDLMVMPGLINLDFNDVRTVMSEMGKAMMGTGEAEGDKRAIEAAEAAISNPLLDEVSMRGAKGVLINITGSMDMTLFEVDEAANRIRAEVDPEANIIVGSTFNQSLEGRVRVSVVATGIDAEEFAEVQPTFEKTRVAATVSKPWRGIEERGRPAYRSAAHSRADTRQAPARSEAHGEAPAAQQQATQQPASGQASSAAAAPQQNPVGDVHERIRRMLTESDTRGDAPARPAPQRPNPFRDQAGDGERAGIGIGAALDLFKSMSSAPKANAAAAADEAQAQAERAAQAEAARATQTPQPKVRKTTHGDLFDDDDDGDLEIPSFLRNRKAI